MQIKSVIIDNIHYINFTTFDISSFFFLICPAEIGVHLIHPHVSYAIKYGICMQTIDSNS